MLEVVKDALRVSGNEFDTEINDLIEACMLDLKTSGVASSYTEESNDNKLVKRAIINYCKAEFGFDNAESEKYRQAYESLKAKLAIVYSNNERST